MAEQRDLPGWPKKRLVKEVRSHLRRYGIRPQGQPWLIAWTWANAIANSYFYTNWPTSSEIGTQYLFAASRRDEEQSRSAVAVPGEQSHARPSSGDAAV